MTITGNQKKKKKKKANENQKSKISALLSFIHSQRVICKVKESC